MKQYLIDSNYILRYLLNDIPSQADTVERYFRQAKNGSVLISVPILAFVECVYILLNLYKLSKLEVVEMLMKFVNIPYLEIEQRNLITKAFLIYKDISVSFVDTLFFIEAHESGRELLTFDKRLKKLAVK